MTAPYLSEPSGPGGSTPQVTTGAATPTPEMLRALIARVPVGLALYNTAGRCVLVNEVLAAANGRSVEEHIGRTMAELFGDAARSLEEQLDRVLRTREPVIGQDVVAAGPDGPRTWQLSWYPATGANGNVLGVIVAAQDVTGERATGAERDRSEARRRTLADAAVASLSVDVLHLDAAGALDEDLPRLRGITGQTRSEVMGAGWLENVHPDDRDRVRSSWQEALAAGHPFEAEYRVVAVDGSSRTSHVRLRPVLDNGEPVEWIGLLRDLTDQRRDEATRRALAGQAQAAAGRTERLQQVTTALSRAVTVSEVVSVVLEHGGEVLGATGRGVALVSEDRLLLRHVALLGYPDDTVRAWNEVDMGATHPLAETVRVGVPFFLPSLADMRERWPVPEVEAAATAGGQQAWAMLPLRTTSEPFGALSFGFAEPRRFDADERTYVIALADQCAQALERARLFERVLAEAETGRRAERVARAAEASAGAAGHRLELLSRATAAVNAAAEPVLALRALTDVVVGELAVLCAIHLVDGQGAEAGRPAEGDGPLLREAVITSRPGLPFAPSSRVPAVRHPSTSPVGYAARTGRAVIAPAADATWTTPQTAEWMRRGGVHTVAALPLVRRGAVAGVVVLFAGPDREPYGEDDLPFLSELAARAATAVDHAEVSRRSRETALTLQRSLLPDVPAICGDVHAVARYVPGIAETEVGGDFYDVIDLGAGRTALVIGDVMGRGVRAAAIMGQLRTAVRTCARLDLPPWEVLTVLDGLVSEIDDSQIVTCVYGVFESHTGLLTLANAGHPPPLVVAPDGLVSRLYMDVGSPLGAGLEEVREYAVRLEGGSMIALFTDGLVESRERDIDAGLADLAVVLSGRRGDLDERADGVLADLGLQQGHDDDAALLLVKLPLQDGIARSGTMTVGDGPEGLSEFRHDARGLLEGWDVGAEVIDSAVLVLSELVTNALLHGLPPLSVRLRRDDVRLVVEVEDGGGPLPRRRRSRAEDEDGRGLEMVASVSAQWGSRTSGAGKTIWAELALEPTATATGEERPAPARRSLSRGAAGAEAFTNLPRARAGRQAVTGEDQYDVDRPEAPRTGRHRRPGAPAPRTREDHDAVPESATETPPRAWRSPLGAWVDEMDRDDAGRPQPYEPWQEDPGTGYGAGAYGSPPAYDGYRPADPEPDYRSSEPAPTAEYPVHDLTAVRDADDRPYGPQEVGELQDVEPAGGYQGYPSPAGSDNGDAPTGGFPYSRAH